jgi:hypothetical protein
MKLVELIPALQTAEETVQRARAFAESCGKEVTVSKDVPGCTIPLSFSAFLVFEADRVLAWALSVVANARVFQVSLAWPVESLH